MSGSRSVQIVGGGLAGMTVAYALAQQGVPVTLYEASKRLGGKAGADKDDELGYYLDHGFHIFPLWYANVRALLDDLGLSHHLIDTDTQHTVTRSAQPDQAGRWYTNYAVTSPKRVWQNFKNSPLRFDQNVVGTYFLLDLAAEPFARSGFLDRVSVNGMFRSRFYRHEAVANFQHFLGLQATSIPGDMMSAMTFQQVLKGFMQYRSKLVGMLDGDLHTCFIAPFAERLRQLHVDVRLNEGGARLMVEPTGNARLVAAWAPSADHGPAPLIVLAAPPKETLAFVDEILYGREVSGAAASDDSAPKSLHGLHALVSEPMAALHVVFKRRLPHIPPWHTGLFQSRYGLSFVDISQHWENLRDQPHTVLSAIAANIKGLGSVTDPAAQAQLILDELLSYIRYDAAGREAVTAADVATVRFNSHEKEPLLLNTTSAWHYRPDGRTHIPNLYVTGDYCRSQADLTCMEGAVYSGLRTAQHILRDLELDPHAAEPRQYKVPPRWLLRGAKWGLFPVIAGIGACYTVSRRWHAWRNRVSRRPVV